MVLPNQFRALRKRFISPERPVPVMVTRLLRTAGTLLPVYSLERPANPATAGLPCIAGDLYRSVLAVRQRERASDHLLLISIADPAMVVIARYVNRLIVHPLRKSPAS